MKTLKELKERIENIEVTYDYEKTYCDLINATIEYQNDTQTWDFEHLFEEYADSYIVEERIKWELEQGGLERLEYFLGNTDLRNEIFRIDAYGNLENIDKEDLECLKQDILEIINDKLEEENDYE